MTDKLRTLAETGAKNEFHPDRQPFNLYDARRSGYVRGFIAGRTSVTRGQVVAVMSKAMDGACTCHLDSYISDGVNAILALLNGDTDE